MNLNKVFILGNVTRDPEQKKLPSGQTVASFGIATNRFYKQNEEKKQEVEFHNIVLFGRLAEIASQYLKKGSLVLIEGRIKTRNWTDTSENKHYKTEIIGEKLQLGPRAGGGEREFESSSAPEKTGLKNQENEIPIIEEEPAANESPAPNKDEKEIDVNDIPF
ncbi:single-stranded DNA-binding protein [Candidatus Atribacteria bacterium MT.SAG.1]|nr:single-stranded DNA-binding protein [Candidatus Atribacteria bacterium MT.SAG.1]